MNNSALSSSEEAKLPSVLLIRGVEVLYWRACLVAFQRLPSFDDRLYIFKGKGFIFSQGSFEGVSQVIIFLLMGRKTGTLIESSRSQFFRYKHSYIRL